MRDPARIKRIISLTMKFWQQVPDWRFGQLLSNLMGFIYTDTHADPFYVEDDKIEELLEKYCKEYNIYENEQPYLLCQCGDLLTDRNPQVSSLYTPEEAIAEKVMNLLYETERILGLYGHSFDDVKWIGTKDFKIPREDWTHLLDVQYDNGFGAQEVACDLLIVGDNWWLERHEYDGAEDWEYKVCPIVPSSTVKIDSVVDKRGGWLSLAEMNTEDEDEDEYECEPLKQGVIVLGVTGTPIQKSNTFFSEWVANCNKRNH